MELAVNKNSIEVIKKAREEIKKGNGMNNYIVILSDMKMKEYLHKICYAELRYTSYKQNALDKRYAKYFLDYPFAKRCGPVDDDIPYINWVVNESIWAPVFITKDAADILENGFVTRTDFPAQFIVQAGMVLRYVTEMPQYIKLWREFSEYVHPMVAFILVHYYRVTLIGDCIRITGRESQHYTNHSVFGWGEMNREILKQWVNNDLSKMTRDRIFKDSTNYSNIMTIWPDVYKKGLELIIPNTLANRPGDKTTDTKKLTVDFLVANNFPITWLR